MAKMLTTFLFVLHAIVFIVWFGLFFIPLTVWPARPAFHFWFVFGVFASELATGGLMTKKVGKFNLICPLTTAMQLSRGYSLQDPTNFDHSFVREVFTKAGIKIPKGWIASVIILTFLVVTIIYASHILPSV